MDMLELKKNDTHILGLKGKLDAVTSPGLRNRLLELVQQGERRILLDCANLDYVSSAGLRVAPSSTSQAAAASAPGVGSGSLSSRSSPTRLLPCPR